MKHIFRAPIYFFLLLCLSCFIPLSYAYATFAQDMSISVQWTDASGTLQWSAPAVPVTDAPEENRFWITLPPEAPLSGLTLNISDLSGDIAYFEPGQGTLLEYVTDAMGSLDQPSVSISGYNAAGELQAVYLLYISYQQLPQTPVNVSAAVTVHYVDEYGNPLLSDMIYTYDVGLHQVTAPDIDQYVPVGSALYIITVDNNGAVPAEITFVYTKVPDSTQKSAHYAEEGNQIGRDVLQTGQQVQSVSWICPKCNKERTSNFCPDCGEKRPVVTQSNTPKPTSTPTPASTIDISDLGPWRVKYYVDRFGDKTNDKYITTSLDLEGTFSNSATSNSKLTARILIDRNDTDSHGKKCTRIAIMLYEYGTHQVKSSYERTYRIYIRDSDGKKFSAKGELSGDRIYINSKGYNKSHEYIKGPGLDDMLNALYKGGDVRFVIEEDDSVTSYSFTIKSSQFYNAFYSLIKDESEYYWGNEPEWAKDMRN